jgi:hypothetical protein
VTDRIPVPLRRHRVAIAGKVVDARLGSTLAGAEAVLVTWPEAFTRARAAQVPEVAAAMVRTASAEDGCFAFADLPDGTYTIDVTLRRSPKDERYGKRTETFVVARAADGHIPVTIRPVPLPPAGVRGLVRGQTSYTDATPAPLPLARVRVQGSGEVAYCDDQGEFYLPDLQTGPRVFSITAAGYAPATKQAVVNRGEVADLGAVALDLQHAPA